ncbi:MAG: winged helix-turn-helix domain-containing protein [Lentisphaerae bacterium]|nr:winged helix-turn-helix domain-containing protein [Lentisphaerota bacterium]
MLKEILNALKKHTAGGVNHILNFIERYPGCQANLIAEKLNISLRTVQRKLSQLKTAGKDEFRSSQK